MKRPENVRCENCVYWTTDADVQPPFWSDTEPIEEGAAWRYCKVGAPTLSELDGDTYTTWPKTYRAHWCGEFRETWPGEVVDFVSLVPAVELSSRARRALEALGVPLKPKAVGALTPEQIMSVKGAGESTVHELAKWVKAWLDTPHA